MKYFYTLTTVALIACLASTADAAPHCTKGKPCGNTCIAQDAVCHKEAPAKECKKGKLCGDTCISKDKECHIK